MTTGFGSTPDARGRGGKQNSGGKDAPTSEARHGRYAEYYRGCRCKPCCAAASWYRSNDGHAERMRARKAQRTPKETRQAFTRILRPIKARSVNQSTGELVLRGKKA